MIFNVSGGVGLLMVCLLFKSPLMRKETSTMWHLFLPLMNRFIENPKLLFPLASMMRAMLSERFHKYTVNPCIFCQKH